MNLIIKNKMKKILFIEDEPSLQKTLGGKLKGRGYEVLCAFDGEEGVRLAGETGPDLILLDIILPKKSGFEVLQDLKSNSETEKIPVIILTNLENIEEVERALELGSTTYLVKANYSLDEVVEKVEKALDRSE